MYVLHPDLAHELGISTYFRNLETPPPYEARIYTGKDNVRLPYRLYVPPKYEASKKYPLVIWLHGSDAIGNDNVKQITGYNIAGTRVWTTAKNRDSFPAIVLAPQSYERSWSFPGLKEPIREEQLVFEMIAALQNELSIDADRIYLVGQSMGGFGTWAYFGNRPDFFAAGIVLCGPEVPTVIPRIAHIPVWVFHGTRDDNVPVTNARRMVESLRKEGGSPRYTEYPNLGHEIGPATFAESELLPWLFAQKRFATHP
jgi:predicted peptidase